MSAIAAELETTTIATLMIRRAIVPNLDHYPVHFSAWFSRDLKNPLNADRSEFVEFETLAGFFDFHGSVLSSCRPHCQHTYTTAPCRIRQSYFLIFWVFLFGANTRISSPNGRINRSSRSRVILWCPFLILERDGHDVPASRAQRAIDHPRFSACTHAASYSCCDFVFLIMPQSYPIWQGCARHKKNRRVMTPTRRLRRGRANPTWQSTQTTLLSCQSANPPRPR